MACSVSHPELGAASTGDPSTTARLGARGRAAATGAASSGSLGCTLDGTDDRLQNLDPREELVLRFHQRPGSIFGAGALDHVARGPFVLVPLLAISPVLRCDLEMLETGLFTLTESA